MSLNLTIEKAIRVAGNQEKLAAMIGVTQSNISGFKRGTRACGFKKRAQLAAIAGENAARTIIEGLAETLDENVPYEAEAKRSLLAMLAAFPQT
jgi:transcriptional regulator with XRE-family HTH domain